MSKNILITGAGSGFGKGAAIALLERGHTVIATTETAAQASTLQAEQPGLQVEKLDITNAADVARVSDWKIDVLINNAGYGQTGPLSQKAGHDLNYCGYAGVADQVGTPSGELALSNLPMGDLLGGTLPVGMTGLPAVQPHLKAGKLKLIASGFSEAAIAVNQAVHWIYPDKKVAPGHSSNLAVFGQKDD